MDDSLPPIEGEAVRTTQTDRDEGRVRWLLRRETGSRLLTAVGICAHTRSPGDRRGVEKTRAQR